MTFSFYNPRIIVFIAMHCAPLLIKAQCDVTVEVPDDLTICTEDDVSLEGNINGSESCFTWTSNHGYFNDSDIDPNVFVDINTTFTFTAFGSIPGLNLITNGDFESGDDGSFSTDYLQATSNCFHGAGFLGCEGVYEIMDDPSTGHTNFDPCPPMGSLQMVVNGAASLQQIWCQDVPVELGKKYEFSAWAQSVNPGSPALLQFSIDDDPIGDILGPSSTTCDWVQVQEYWIANTTGDVEICVLNQNTAAGGNDFAIDDIFFGELCSDQKELEVIVGDLSIDPEFPEEFNCNTLDLELSLNPDGSFGPFEFEWYNEDFNIINEDNNGNAVIFLPGTYIVTVIDQLGCEIEHYFDVEENLTVPEIILDPIDAILQCDDSFINIFNEEDDADYEYYWEWEGVFFSDDNILQATNPGVYELTVTDETNGCTSTSNVTIGTDMDIPSIDAIYSNEIDCNNPTAELSIETTDNLSEIEWFDEEGNPLASTIVSEGGFYSVTVVAENGCITDDFLNLPENIFDPQVEVMEPTPISCANPQSILSLNYTGNLILEWSGPNMFSASGNDLLVDFPGIYTANLSNATGCSLTIEIEILADLQEPNITIAPYGQLDCDIESIPITITNFDPNINYVWTLVNNSTETGQMINVSTPGLYSLLATAQNGCTDEELIEIQSSGNLPEVSLSVDPITCNNLQSSLEATGNYISLEWSDNNGTISNLNVSDEGWYYAYADNGGGCDVLDSIYLNVDTIAPVINFDAPTINCEDVTDMLFNSLDDNYNYQWILPDGTASLSDTIAVELSGNYQVTISAENTCYTESNILVEADQELPLFEVSGLDTIDCQNSQINIDLEILSQIDSIVLKNELGMALDDSLVIQKPGAYQLEFHGSNGCIDSFNFYIPIDTIKPNPIIINNNIDCNTDIAQLAITNPQSSEFYEWSNLNTTGNDNTFTTNLAGDVSLYVTDLTNGCTNQFTTEIVIDTLKPTLNYQAPLLTCLNQEAEIQLFPDGNYNYEWTLPSLDTFSGMNLIAKDTGEYILKITGQNGCKNTYFIDVEGNLDIPQFEVLQPPPITCLNKTTTIQIESDELLGGYIGIFGGNSFNFGSGDLVTDQAGAWTVQVTAPGGCTNSISFEILADTISPNPQVKVQNIDCVNSVGFLEILNSDPASSFEWIDEEGNTTFDEIYYPTPEATITLVETASNGCVGFTSAMVMIDTISPSLSLTSSLITCNQPESEISIINPIDSIEYQWQFQNEFISADHYLFSDQLGNYTVIATNLNNKCSSVEEIEIQSESNIPIDFNFEIVAPPCGEEDFYIEGFSISGGIGPYQYSTQDPNPNWSPLEVEQLLSLGQNLIQIQDSNGCILDSLIYLDIPEPVEVNIQSNILINWATDTTLQLTINKPLEDIDFIEWTPATGLSCDDCLNPVVNLEEDQIYQVLVVDKNGCEDLVEIRIEVIKFISVFIPNVFTPDNQDNNLFFPFSTEQHITQVDKFYIYDRWGNRVFTNSNFLPNDPLAGWDGSILSGDALPGVYSYMLQISYTDGSSEIIIGDVTLVR